MATHSLFIPERPQGLYTESPTALAEDNRTRYLFIPFLPFRHQKIDLSTGNFYMQHIPEGRIVMVKKHQYHDPCLSAAECDNLASTVGPTRKGEIGVKREKGVIPQVKTLLKSYARKGLVELKAPLEIREQQLPDGWDIEFATSVILDGLLNPPDDLRTSMDYQDMANWYKSEAVIRLQQASEYPSVPSPRWYTTRSEKDLVALPEVLVGVGLALLDEFQAALKTAMNSTSNKINLALDEMQGAKTPKGGRSKLSATERRAFKWAGQPTPLERDMLFEQNRETGLLDKLGSFVSNLRQPAAPVVEVLSEDEIERRAEEKAEAMVEKILAKMASQKAAAEAPKPATVETKVEDTPRRPDGKFTKKEEPK